MFLVGLFIGMYAYLLFLLGIVGFFTREVIILCTILYFGSIFLWCIRSNGLNVISLQKQTVSAMVPVRFTLIRLLLFLLGGQILVNSIGVLGPELGFDALWYHLTIPKLYLLDNAIRFIPGGLLYYSAMPKMTELIYAAALAFQGDTLAKVVHFFFGLGACISIYLIGRKYFSQTIALVAVVIYYANLVVAWESMTAYIDLARTFYEILALWAFLQWTENTDKRYLALAGVMVGFAIATKLLALGSVGIFTFLLFLSLFKKRKPILELLRSFVVLIVPALLLPLPWFVFSYLNTGNPVYPFFTPVYETGISLSLLLPSTFLIEFWNIFMNAADPLSPVYMLLLPFIFFVYKTLPQGLKTICWYALLAAVVWYLTPRTGGGRFMLPFLPAFSLIAAGTIDALQKDEKYAVVAKAALYFVFLIAVISIGYRGAANVKYLPVIVGLESRAHFLKTHLNFSYGDFYDIDGFFTKLLKPGEKVLLYGFHNLYYVHFPFIHESWVKKGDTFTYIAVQNGSVPERFKDWKQIYYNGVTSVTVYSKGDKQWVY